MEKITIKLSESLSANQFGEGERIHYKAFGKAKLLIEEQIKAAVAYRNFLEKQKGSIRRSNHAISVFGERGVGKTSFLMSLRDSLSNVGNIQILPLVDPTLIEEKGHIFLLIVSLIDQVVCDALDRGCCNGEGDCYQEWDHAKARLAAGLPSLQPLGLTYHEPQWNEDEYVMKNGLESVKAAFNLERNFHYLIKLALSILNKDAFVLMFDDIDVDFKRGWDLLETVRKFLTSPQIVILLSGNQKLFSKNVRKQQWHNLGKELLKNEVDIKDVSAIREYTQLVNELEGQYMLKILNSEKRVYLYDIGKNITMNGDDYWVEYEGEDSFRLEDTYLRVLRKYGIYNKAIARIYIDFLESTSMRTQVHFLFNAWMMRKDDDEQNMLSAISAFSSRIYAQNVNIELAANESLFPTIVMHYLIRQRLVEDAYQLLPSFESTDTNCVVSGFSFLFAMMIKKQPNLIFDYWVKICMTRNAMRYLVYDTEEGVNRRLNVEFYCQEIGVYQKRNLRTIVGNGLAYALSLNEKQALDGSVKIFGFGGLAKKADMRNRIDMALYDKQEQQILGYLPLVCLLHTDKNQRELFLSFNALLANIGQVVNSATENNVKQVLLSACQPVNYQIKSDVSASTSSLEDENGSEIELNLVDDFGVGEFVMQWKKKYTGTCYSPDLFGRIATRYYFAQSSILENNRDAKLGDLFSLLTLAFLNACLIEEVKSRNDIGLLGININNVSTSSYIFVTNIRKIVEQDNWKDKIPFTKWMMACPLLFPFIDKKDGYNILNFIKDCFDNDSNIEDYMLRTEMVDLLNDIDVFRQRTLVTFSVAQDKIEQTIARINDAHVEAELIFDEQRIREAQRQLSLIFKSVRFQQIRALRGKCQISPNGFLIVL